MSEKLKPIETGCMAMLINAGKWSGIAGKVGQWHEVGTHLSRTGRPNPWAGWMLNAGRFNYVVRPDKLMRIDGHELTEIEQAYKNLRFD